VAARRSAASPLSTVSPSRISTTEGTAALRLPSVATSVRPSRHVAAAV
jgi:hypothetical protein